jgi:hypothetical protein
MQQSTTMRAALIAGAALVAAGAFATALGEETANRTAPTSLGSGSKMTVGETATTPPRLRFLPRSLSPFLRRLCLADSVLSAEASISTGSGFAVDEPVDRPRDLGRVTSSGSR